MLRPALLVALLLLGGADTARAFPEVLGLRAKTQIPDLNRRLAGRVVDYTDNHGVDRRLLSPALGEKRDCYVYLPPGYDGVRRFPVMLFFHGLGQDEKIFLDIAPKFDDAIRAGTCPPMVIVMPDGTVDGRPKLTSAGSFYINSKAGRFGDYVAHDIWPWVLSTFAVRPERDAHCVAGASMGGFGAYNVAFKNRDQFAHVVGIMPPLNLRYGDAAGKYLSDFDPDNFALRPIESRNEVIGRFLHGTIAIRSRRMLDPVVGTDFTNATAFVSRENPYEMLRSYAVKPNEFNLFIGYGKNDEFNVDAACESFIAEAARLGIHPTAIVIPDGRHSVKTATDMIPAVNQWLADKFRPFTPPGWVAPTANVVVRPTVALRPLDGLGGWGLLRRR